MFTLPEEVARPAKTSGFATEARNGNGKFDLLLAATFVVDTSGSIIFAMVDSDDTHRAEPADIIAAVESVASKSAG